MKRVLAIVLALSVEGSVGVAAAQTREPTPPPGDTNVVLRKGEPAPADGIFADAALAKYELDRLHKLELFKEECAKKVGAGDPLDFSSYAVVGGVGLVVGVVLGVVLHSRWEK